MTDFAKFGIELVDAVSKPATRAADALERMESRVGGAERAVGRLEGSMRNLMHSRAFELIAGHANNLATSMEGIFMRGVRAAYGIGETLVRGVIGMAASMDGAQRSLAALTGSEAKGQEAFRTATRLSNELGTSLGESVEGMRQMLAMQFKIGEAEELMKISADLRAITGHGHAAARALTAITQIKAKGKLQAEELVSQLAESGVSTVLVYDELSKMLNKDVAGVRKMLAAGLIDADTGITAIKRAIMKKVHETAPGEAAARYSATSLTGLWDRVKQAPEKLYAKVADSIKDLVPRLTKVVQSMLDFIDKIDQKKVASFVSAVISVLEKGVKLARAFGEGFLEGFQAMTTQFGAVELTASNLEAARDMGRSFAESLGRIVSALTRIADLMQPLMSDTGMWLAGGLYLATKLGGALSNVAAILQLFGVGGAARAAAALGGAAGGGGGAAAAGGAAKALGGFTLGAGAGTALAVGSGLALAGGIGYAAYGLYEANEERKRTAEANAQWARSHAQMRRERALSLYESALTGATMSEQPAAAAAAAGPQSRYAMSTREDTLPQIDAALAAYEASARRAADTSRFMPPPAKGGILGRAQMTNQANITNNFYVNPTANAGKLTPEGAREMADTVKEAQDGNIIDTLAQQMGTFLAAR